MKIISFRGKLAIGTQNRIKLSTLNGKTGYKIHKFQMMSTAPGTAEEEIITKLYTKTQTGSIDPTVDFTDSQLLAAIYYQEHNSAAYPGFEQITLDTKIFNQDIFVTTATANGSTTPITYYIELEVFPIDDVEATQLTLQSIRTITSR